MNGEITSVLRVESTSFSEKQLQLTLRSQFFLEESMNFSQSSSIENESDCKSFFLRYPLTDSSSYGSLIIAAVLSSIACPFTIFLNALAMVAVKIKRRLQTHPNILLACMAVTDLLVGLVVQPLYITNTIFLLQGKGFHEFCDIEEAFTVSFTLVSTASLLHLVLISGERYLAVNHTFTHAYVVTKTRLMVSSAAAWITTGVSLLVSSYFPFLTPLLVAVSTAAIVVLQLLVYKEVSRHEKQILSQQISLEARAKFENDKALKLTTIIITVVFLVHLCTIYSSGVYKIICRILFIRDNKHSSSIIFPASDVKFRS